MCDLVVDVDVSVIIPTYNRPNIIISSLTSVLFQTYNVLEIIIVDGSDNDETRMRIESFHDKRIKYLKVDNVSVANSRNIGIEEASGDFIAFNDDDDVWLNDKIEKQVRFYKKKFDKNFILYSSCLKGIWGGNRRIPDDTVRIKSGDIYEEVLLRNFIGLPSVMLPASICRDIKFDQQLKCLEDWEWMIRLSKLFSFEFIPEVLVSVNDTPGSVNKSKYSVKARSYMAVYKKHYDDISLAPEIESKHLLSIGSNFCLSGQMDEGRSYLLKSMKLGSKKTYPFIAYLFSFLGWKAFCFSFKIFEKITCRQP